MLFPEVERVIYNKNPLQQVICQLRYPVILKIETQEPAEFQEEIRQVFPIFQERREADLQIPNQILQTLPPDFINMMGISNKNYEFLDSDEIWRVNLTREFITLTSYNYKNWEKFEELFTIVFEAFVKVYKPSYFTRIGLRYQNIIQRSKLGLDNAEWSDLLKSHIIGLLAYDTTHSQIRETITRTNIELDSKDNFVNLRNGLAKNENNNEICYLVDNDLYTQNRTGVSDAIQILRNFNQQNRRLFRWCITDKLHTAMEPKPTNV